MSGVRTIGPYRVEKKLGAGGMGAVFQVVHATLGARYALKAYLGGPIDAQQLTRFEREIEALGAVHHPNLVRIHTAGHENGRPYYVMDLVEGEDLQHRLAKGGPFAARDAVAIVRDVALAVAALHARGIVHRDIKPANVIVTPEGRVLLTDLGVAKIISDGERERLTRTGELVGTPAYMAPEQALGLPESAAPVDVWAMGMLLYTLLAGRTALKPGNALALLQQVAQGLIIPLPESAPEVPREVCILVASALRRDAADRPDAATWARALDAWLRGETPPSDESLLRTEPAPARGAVVGIALVLLLAAGAALGWALLRGPGSTEPIALRAQRACEVGLAALGSGSGAPLESGALAAIGSELEVAIAARGEGVRELQATRALLLLLEAEGALRRSEPALAEALLAGLPPEGEVARERLPVVRALRAAVSAGIEGAKPDSISLDQAVALWPDWAELRARKIARAQDPRDVVGDAAALLALEEVDPELRRKAAEALSAAEAWDALEPWVEGLGEPYRSRALARRALAALPRSSMEAALILAQGVRLAPDDPVRVRVTEELRRLIATTSHLGTGLDTVEPRRREGWAHVALHHVDPAHVLGKDRGDAMVALPFDIGVLDKTKFTGDVFDLVTSLVPLYEGERRGNMYLTVMFAVNELWILLPEPKKTRGAQVCREGYAYCRAYPHLVGPAADRLGNLLVNLGQVAEVEVLARDAPPLVPEEERRLVRSNLLTHLGHALGEPQCAKALAALDEALELDPGNTLARNARIGLRNFRWMQSGKDADLDPILEDLYARLLRPGAGGNDDLAARGEMATDSEWGCNIEQQLGRQERAIEILAIPLQRGKGYGQLAIRWLVLRIAYGRGPQDAAAMLQDLDEVEARLRWDLALYGRVRAEGEGVRNLQSASMWIGKMLDGLPAVREALSSEGVVAAGQRLILHHHTVETERAKLNEARNAQREREKARAEEKGR